MAGAGELLALLRHGRSLTRAQIVAESGLARATVTHRLDQLMTAGLVVPAPSTRATGGRPATALTLNPDRGILLVADIGSSHARVGVADLGGHILTIGELDLDIDAGADLVLPAIDRAFDEALAALDPSDRAVLGVGIGVPGPVEHASGRLVSPPTMPGWDGVNIREHVRARTSAPVAVDKDANLMAVGVHRALGRVADDALVLKVGMGIGAGIISRGQILRGARGAAGDLGHIPRAGGATCRCGQQGCAEATAGGWAIAQRLRDAGYADIRASADIMRLAQAGDALTIDLLREAGQRIGEAVVEAVGVLNPAVVVVGGNVADAHETLIAGIRERIYRLSHPLATKELQVIVSPLGPDAGLIGAAQLAADAALAPARVDRDLLDF